MEVLLGNLEFQQCIPTTSSAHLANLALLTRLYDTRQYYHTPRNPHICSAITEFELYSALTRLADRFLELQSFPKQSTSVNYAQISAAPYDIHVITITDLMDSSDPSNNYANVHSFGKTHTSTKSPVLHLLKSNHPPTSLEVALTCDAMKAIQTCIGAMDEEISKARAVVENLLDQREAMQASSNAHAGIISTLRRVPPEIMSYIFVFCLPTTTVDPSAYGMAPVLLENICRRWRDIARTTPKLWTSFRLSITTRTIERDTLAAKTWPSRSGNLPLTITLGTPVFEKCVTSPEAHIVLDAIFTQCRRWKEVTSFLPHSLFNRFAAVKGQLPILENINITDSKSFQDPHKWPFPVEAFKDAPRLKSLGLDARMTKNDLDITWHALTKLVLGQGTSRAFMTILRDCPGLEALTIRDIEDDSRSGHARFELSYLHTLDIATGTKSRYFFTELVLPALRHVAIRLSPDYESEFSDGEEELPPTCWESRQKFLSLLSRSKCSIQSIIFESESDCFSEADLIYCLKALPSLVELEIKDYATFALTRSVLHRMTYDHDKALLQLVPDLHTLKIDWVLQAFHDEAFAPMVGSRWVLNGPPDRKTLKTVELHIIPPAEEAQYGFEDHAFDPIMIRETARVLRRCKTDGMEANVIKADEDWQSRTDWLMM